MRRCCLSLIDGRLASCRPGGNPDDRDPFALEQARKASLRPDERHAPSTDAAQGPQTVAVETRDAGQIDDDLGEIAEKRSTLELDAVTPRAFEASLQSQRGREERTVVARDEEHHGVSLRSLERGRKRTAHASGRFRWAGRFPASASSPRGSSS